MYRILFINVITGKAKALDGLPNLGGAISAAADLLPCGPYRASLRTPDYRITFTARSDREEVDEWGVADLPTSVEILDRRDGSLLWDFNAESRHEAARWARRILGIC
jgi:hypothetical protein